MRPNSRMTLVLAAAGLLAALPALADNVLPIPPPPFKGKIGKTIKDSKADYPAQLRAPKGAPNVLLILLDDVGFGHAKTFGGRAETPTMDRLAKMGLRYNTFHTTALCSPTRATLLTGRNHHSVGTGVIIEIGTGFPGYTGIVPEATVGLPEILRQNGYATAAFGKWHNTPDVELAPSGPFDRWPTGKTWGFQYFYGFMNGETSQFYPVLYRNTSPVPQPRTPEQGYHLTEDLADEAIAWMRQVKATDPEKPWFIYFSTGGIHGPHHVPKAYREKYAGQFDDGWDQYRQTTFERQKQLGFIPADAKLTPRPPEIPAWADQPAEDRKVYSRLAENYSGFLEHTDVEVGRVIDAIEKTGALDNTLILYVVGDNGASAEGGLQGTVNEIASLNGIQLGLAGLRAKFDQIGGPETEPHVPVGWAWAMDTPFQWTKQVASHFGGTRNPLIVVWPKRIKDQGGLRSQFHHVVDVVPTILEATGIKAPTSVDGVKQKPIEGISMVYTFDKAQEKAEGRRKTQYFEMFGNRAVYSDGWIAAARHGRFPWGASPPGFVQGDFDHDHWELYNVKEDFSEATDLAATNPAKLKELQAKFDQEAKKHDVFPLDDRTVERFDTRLRPNPMAGMTRFSYGAGVTGIPEGSAPNTVAGPYTITAQVEVGDHPTGVIVAMGGLTSGWSLYLQDGKPTFYYNFFEVGHYKVQSPQPLPKGTATIEIQVAPVEDGFGKPRAVLMSVNGKRKAAGKIERSVPFRYGVEPFDIGMDTVSSVSSDYSVPNAFTGGAIDNVTIDVGKVKLTSQEVQQINNGKEAFLLQIE